MDAISEQRLAQVYPLLADKVRKMSDTLAQEGIEIRVVQGYRSFDEQQALYEQGRTKPGKIVTNCPGGKSYHNVGLAVDCVPSQFGPDKPYNPDWNNQHPDWKRMEEVGVSLGLDSGATWRTFKDWPHFQYTCEVFPEGAPDGTIKGLYNKGGLQAVWNELENRLSKK